MRRFMVILFVVSFALRLGAVAAWRDVNVGPVGESSDDDVQFHTFALNLANGYGYSNVHGEPTSFRAPGYPFFLAAIYSLIGPHAPAVYVVMCLLGAAACVLTYVLARELVAENYARVAGILAAFYLPHIYFATNFISENLYIPLFTLGLWLFICHIQNRQIKPLVLCGLVLGYAALTRPFVLLLLPLFSVMLLCLHYRSIGTLFKSGFAYGLPFLALVLPWTVRNHNVHGNFVLATTNGGSTFYGGNNDLVLHERRHWGFWVSTTDLPGRDKIDAQPTEYLHDQMEWKLGKQWVREHWMQMPVLWLLKLARLWWLPELGGAHRILRVACYLPWLLLIVAGWWCMVRSRIYWTPSWWVVHGALLTTFATVMIFCGLPRFRDANLPILMIYAAVGLQAVLRFSSSFALQSSAADLPQTKSTA